ncbi:MAG: zinc ABC transporter substrate-binding protein [Phycisphaerales bacterium]|nr:zinc ABC transporter substrate-binding protein [Phycisphaerales bacterium]
MSATALVLAAGVWTACDRQPATAPAPGRPPLVFTTLAPVAFFAEQIGGENVRVESLVQPGQSPHTFEPTPRQMAALADAAMYLHLDEPFEERLIQKLRASNQKVRFVDVREGIDLLPLDVGHDEHDHEGHDHHEGHEHGPLDPHIWLDPRRVRVACDVMCDAMSREWPDHAAAFRANCERLKERLDQLDGELRAKLRPIAGKPFFVTHAAFGYFAEAYGLEQVSVEVGGRQPGPRELEVIADRLGLAKPKRVFYDPQSSRNLLEALRSQAGVEAEPLDPLRKDYFENMRHIADSIVASIGDAQ